MWGTKARQKGSKKMDTRGEGVPATVLLAPEYPPAFSCTPTITQSLTLWDPVDFFILKNQEVGGM